MLMRNKFSFQKSFVFFLWFASISNSLIPIMLLTRIAIFTLFKLGHLFSIAQRPHLTAFLLLWSRSCLREEVWGTEEEEWWDSFP